MFSQASVILSTGGGHVWQGEHVWHVWLGGMRGKGGMHGKGGMCDKVTCMARGAWQGGDMCGRRDSHCSG